MKKGFIPIGDVVLIVLVIGVVFYGLFHFFGGTDGLFNILKIATPDLNKTVDISEDATLAYKLEDGNLKRENGEREIYSFDGSSLNALPEDHPFRFNGQDLSYDDLRKLFEEYYYKTHRDYYSQADLSLLDNDRNFKKLVFDYPEDILPEDISQNKITGTLDYPLGFNPVSMTITENYQSGGFNQLGSFIIFMDGSVEYQPKVKLNNPKVGLESESKINREISSAAILWRDSILQGGACEKYITLFGKNYKVRNLDNQYLVVDFGKPISGQDKYSLTRDCTVVQ
jgi:hypothetical protein